MRSPLPAAGGSSIRKKEFETRSNSPLKKSAKSIADTPQSKIQNTSESFVGCLSLPDDMGGKGVSIVVRLLRIDLRLTLH